MLEIDPSDLVAPSIQLENTATSHKWLQYSAEAIGVYNAYDCLATALAYRGLQPLLDRAGNRAYYNRWFSRVVPAALNIQRRGFGHLDRGRLAAYKEKLNKDLEELDGGLLARAVHLGSLVEAAEEWRRNDAALDLEVARAKNAAKKNPFPESEVVGTRGKRREIGFRARVKEAEEARRTFLNSRGETGQLAKWLFDTIGFKAAPKTDKRPARSTAQSALMHIYTHLRKLDEPNKWILEDLFHRSRLSTIRSRYLNFETGPDNRVYPRIRLYTAETLRWAYSDPPLHQWPDEIRHLIVARPGYVFVRGDYSQCEARIMAYLAGEKKDIEAFSDKTRDVHAETAQDIFGISPTHWAAMDPTLRKKHRDYAKKKRFEIGYGASEKGAGVQQLFCPCPRCADKVPQFLQLTPAQNKLVMQRWSSTRATTMRWRDQLFESVIANGRRFQSRWGFTRQFCAPARESRNSIWNCPMQSGASEIANEAITLLDQMGAPVVQQMHDDIKLEVLEREAPLWEQQLREVMERPIAELNGVRFPVDIHTGHDWGELR